MSSNLLSLAIIYWSLNARLWIRYYASGFLKVRDYSFDSSSSFTSSRMFQKVMFVSVTILLLALVAANCSGLQKKRLRRAALPGIITTKISPRLKRQVERLIQNCLDDLDKLKGNSEINQSLKPKLDRVRNRVARLQQFIRNY